MLSSYRLGDLVVFKCLNTQEINELLKDYPNSLGAKYIRQRTDKSNGVELFTNLVVEYLKENSDFLPDDIENCTVIHVRLGDALKGTMYHEKTLRPFPIDHIKNIALENGNKNYVIGKPFFAKTSSTNYQECIDASKCYLSELINETNAIHLNLSDVDKELCCAVKAKLFIQGKGYFSKLIVEIRKKLNLKSIECISHDWSSI